MTQVSAATQAGHTQERSQVLWVRGIAVLLSTALLALAAPIIASAVAAGVGLLVLGLLALSAFALMQALPLGLQKLENRLLAARKAEARANPIEQLQNEVLRRAERLRSFRKALVTVGGRIESIQQMIETSQTQFKGPVLASQERALVKLQQFHRLNVARLDQADVALREFKNTVALKQSQYEISLAIDDANRAMDPNAAEHLIQELLTDTALRSVQDRFNNVFAELDVHMCSLDSPTREMLGTQGLDRVGALTLPQTQRGGDE